MTRVQGLEIKGFGVQGLRLRLKILGLRLLIVGLRAYYKAKGMLNICFIMGLTSGLVLSRGS